MRFMNISTTAPIVQIFLPGQRSTRAPLVDLRRPELHRRDVRAAAARDRGPGAAADAGGC